MEEKYICLKMVNGDEVVGMIVSSPGDESLILKKPYKVVIDEVDVKFLNYAPLSGSRNIVQNLNNCLYVTDVLPEIVEIYKEIIAKEEDLETEEESTIPVNKNLH